MIAVVIGLSLGVVEAAARACGVWHLTDHQRKVDVEYLVSTVSVRRERRRVGVFYIDETPTGLRVTAGRKAIFMLTDGILRRRGARVGTLADDGTLVIGKRTYAIEMPTKVELHGQPAWHVEVREGDAVLASGDAMALCSAVVRDPDASDEVRQRDIRVRVAYYLAWRQLGA